MVSAFGPGPLVRHGQLARWAAGCRASSTAACGRRSGRLPRARDARDRHRRRQRHPLSRAGPERIVSWVDEARRPAGARTPTTSCSPGCPSRASGSSRRAPRSCSSAACWSRSAALSRAETLARSERVDEALRGIAQRRGARFVDAAARVVRRRSRPHPGRRVVGRLERDRRRRRPGARPRRRVGGAPPLHDEARAALVAGRSSSVARNRACAWPAVRRYGATEDAWAPAAVSATNLLAMAEVRLLDRVGLAMAAFLAAPGAPGARSGRGAFRSSCSFRSSALIRRLLAPFDGGDQLVELELDRQRVLVLRALDEEDHQEGDDRGAGVDHELPGVGVAEERAQHGPAGHDPQRAQEGPVVLRSTGSCSCAKRSNSVSRLRTGHGVLLCHRVLPSPIDAPVAPGADFPLAEARKEETMKPSLARRPPPSPPWRRSPPPPTGRPTLALRVKRVQAVQVSPDGSRVAYVVGAAVMDGEKSEWLSHVHVARADGSGAFALTSGDKSSTGPAWSPDGKWIAFLSGRGPKDKDGKDPKANVWRIRVDGGEAEALTDEKGGVSAFAWSPDGKAIAFLMTDPKTDDEEKADKEKRDARVVDEDLKLTRLYVVPVEKDADGQAAGAQADRRADEPRQPGGPADFAWSPDGAPHRLLAPAHAAHQRLAAGGLSIVDVATGKVRALAVDERGGVGSRLLADGKQVAFDQSNDPPTWRRRSRVAIVPVEGGTPRPAGRDARRAARPRRLDEGRPHRLRRDAPHGQPRRRAAGRRRRADVREPGRRDGGRPVAERGGHARRLQLAGARPRGGAVLGAARALRAGAGGRRCRTLPAFAYGRTETLTWKSPDGKEVEGLVTYPGRLRGRQEGAAAGRGARRPGRRLRPVLHRRAHRLSGRGLRRARVRRPAREPARQQRLRLRLPQRRTTATGARATTRTSCPAWTR